MTSLGATFDENMAYSFHYYNTPPHLDNIQKYLSVREQYNRPLWLGEFGEEANRTHYACVVRMAETRSFRNPNRCDWDTGNQIGFQNLRAPADT